MNLKDIFKGISLHILFLLALLWLYLYSLQPTETVIGILFWWSLKIMPVLIAVGVGFFVRDFWRIVCLLTFVLAVFSAATIFDQMREEFYSQFFLVVYVIFLGFASLGNVVNKFINWMLIEGNTGYQ